MTELRFITNTIGSVAEAVYDGKPYLIAPAVAIREGVLNDILYLSGDIGQHADSWNGHVVPIGHPKRNGEYVSANSRDVWATEVLGNFWDVAMDRDRLKGDIWVDLEKAEKLGEPALDIVNRLRAGEPIEVSTGVLIDLEETAGIWNGKSYAAIARNIFPDHLALLPNEVGACSWDDGCGTPRINKKEEGMGVTTNEMTLDDRAMLVRRAFWEQVSMGDAEPMVGDWDVLAVFDDTLIAKDWMSKGHMAFPYTLSESDSAVTFGDSTPVEVVYRAKEGGAEVVIVNTKPVSLLARVKQWLKSDKTDSVAVQQQEEEDVKKCEMVTALVANKQVKFNKEELEKFDEPTLQKLVDSFATNEEVAEPVAPVTEPVAAPAAVQLPQEVLDFVKMIQGLGGVEKLGAALGSITANADSEKTELVADLVANEQCQVEEATLKAMSVGTLRQLAGSFQLRDYSGAGGVIRNSGDNKEFVLEMPKLEWAVGKEAK